MLNVVWGSNKEKPQAANALVELLTNGISDEGYLYIGYPIVGSPLGPVKFDALLVSRAHGLIGFDLVEGTELGEFHGRLDDIASMLEVKLKPYPKLKNGRQLSFAVNTITFAPAKQNPPASETPYLCANRTSLIAAVTSCGLSTIKQRLRICWPPFRS